MKTLSLLAVIALAFMSVGWAADKSPAEPPVRFLQTDDPAARRALATKITADFRDTPIRKVIDYLVRAAQINTVMKLDVNSPQAVDDSKEVDGKIPGAPRGATGAPKDELKITRKFENVPLRAVYYQLSQDTGLTIEWRLYGEKPVGIIIRNH